MNAYITYPQISDISEFLVRADEEGRSIAITTLNPEMLLAAQKNHRLTEALAHSDLGLIDGVGLGMILKAKTGKKFTRKTGVDTVIDLTTYALQKKWAIVVVGDSTVLDLKYYAAFEGAYLIQVPKINNYEKMYRAVIERLPQMPSVVLLGLGMGKQEYVAHRLTREVQNVKIAIGVGGAFAMFAGKLPRAPVILRRLGLEWVWRLCLEPSRFKRIIRAVIVFPLISIRHKVYE